MKTRSHNSRSSNAGIDPRALQKAAALLVEAIGAAIAERYPSDRASAPRPAASVQIASGICTAAAPAAPVTREEAVKIAARLYTLGRACSYLSLPVQLAAAWLPLTDVAAFADRAEEHIRRLVNLFDEAMAAHPSALQERGAASTGITTQLELDGAKKLLERLGRLDSIEIDLGPLYVPPECRPEGFVENWPPLRDPHNEAVPDPEDGGGDSDER